MVTLILALFLHTAHADNTLADALKAAQAETVQARIEFKTALNGGK